MTTGGSIEIPADGYTAQTIFNLQNIDPENLGAAQNIDMWEMLENFRNKLLTDLLGGFASVPIAVLDGIGDVIAAITGLLNGDLDDLNDWAQGIVAGFQDLLAALRGDYTGTDTFLLQIQSWSNDLFAWVEDVADFVQNLLDAVVRGIRGIPVVGAPIADVIAELTGMNNRAATALSTANTALSAANDAQDAINDLSQNMAALQVTAVYESLSQHDIVSFPRFTLGLGMSDATSSVAGHSHSYNSTTNSIGQGGAHSHSVSREMPTVVPAKGGVGYVPLFVNRYCKPRRLKLITGDSGWSPFAIDAWYVALCVYNPATGNVEKVWDGGDRKSSITTAKRLHAFDMGVLGNVNPGTILFGAQLQTAGILTSTRPLAGLWQPDLVDPSAELLTAPFYRLGGQTTIPSSIPLTSLTPDNDTLPWMAVGVDPAT